MNRGYILPIIFVILAVTARNAVHSACTVCDNKCANMEQYDRVECDASDLTIYCECSSAGKGSSKTCFTNYYYDKATQSCIWKNSVSPPGTGTVDCTGKPDGFKIRNSNDECNKYTLCTTTGPVPDQDCPTTGPTVFNPMVGECVSPDTYYCVTTQSNPEGKLPDCAPYTATPSKFYTDKENCAGYYYCIGGMRIKGKCDAQQFDFDPIEQRCSYKSGNCEPVIVSPSSAPGSKDIDRETICKGKSGQFLADPRVCNAYIYCMSETKPRQDFCKVGTYFNNGFCSKTPPATCNCELVELQNGETKYAADVDKRKFYICSENGREEKTCPTGTVWNLKAESCEL